MSTEVECKVDSGLTATSSAGGEENQNKCEQTPLQKPGREPEEQGQKRTEKQHSDGQSTEVAKSPMDLHKKCKENDKENDQNAQSSNVDPTETVKRKVVEAPPPKVNPWTKRTTGRVSNNTINSSSQEKGKIPLT